MDQSKGFYSEIQSNESKKWFWKQFSSLEQGFHLIDFEIADTYMYFSCESNISDMMILSLSISFLFIFSLGRDAVGRHKYKVIRWAKKRKNKTKQNL